MSLVFFITFSLADGEGVAEDVEHLQILEFSLFVRASAEVCDDFLERADLVVANGEDIEFGAVMESIKHHDSIVIEGKIGQID